MRTAEDPVGGSDPEVEVGSAGPAGVARDEDLLTGNDDIIDFDHEGVAVAVRPASPGLVLDRDADAAG